MAYQCFFDKATRRIEILNTDSHAMSKEVDFNLEGKELRILLAKSDICPLEKSCVSAYAGYSSVCTYLKIPYMMLAGLIKCGYKGEGRVLALSNLAVESCPAAEKHNCKGCTNLEDVFIPVRPGPCPKSHAHIVCWGVKN
jgi:hypothetical protein